MSIPELNALKVVHVGSVVALVAYPLSWGPATWIMIVGAVMVLLGVILCRVGSDHTNPITLFAFGSLGVLALAAGGWVWWSARAKYVLCLVSSNGPRVVFSDPNKTRVEQIAQAIRQVIGKRH